MKKEKKNELQFRPVLFKNCQAFFKHSFPVYFKLDFRFLSNFLADQSFWSVTLASAVIPSAALMLFSQCLMFASMGFLNHYLFLSLPCLIASSIVFFFSRSAIYFPYGFSTSKIISAVMLSFITPPILWSSSFTKSKASTVLSYLQ